MALEKVIEEHFAEEYDERTKEVADDTLSDQRRDNVPVFEEGIYFPGQRAVFNFYEPRYVALARRCIASGSPFVVVSRKALGLLNERALARASDAERLARLAGNQEGAARGATTLLLNRTGTLCDIEQHAEYPDGRIVCSTRMLARVRIVETRVEADRLTVATVQEVEDVEEDEEEPTATTETTVARADDDPLRTMPLAQLESELQRLMHQLFQVSLLFRLRALFGQRLPPLPTIPRDCDDASLWAAPFIPGHSIIYQTWLEMPSRRARLVDEITLLQRHIRVSRRFSYILAAVVLVPLTAWAFSL